MLRDCQSELPTTNMVVLDVAEGDDMIGLSQLTLNPYTIHLLRPFRTYAKDVRYVYARIKFNVRTSLFTPWMSCRNQAWTEALYYGSQTVPTRFDLHATLLL